MFYVVARYAHRADGMLRWCQALCAAPCSPLALKGVPTIGAYTPILAAQSLPTTGAGAFVNFRLPLIRRIHHKIWQRRSYAFRQRLVFGGLDDPQSRLHSFTLPVSAYLFEQVIIGPNAISQARLHGRSPMPLVSLQTVVLAHEVIIHDENGLRINVIGQLF